MYAWRDLDANREYDPFDDEPSWIHDDQRFSRYSIDTSGAEHRIVYLGPYSINPVPKDLAADRFAAPMEINFVLMNPATWHRRAIPLAGAGESARPARVSPVY